MAHYTAVATDRNGRAVAETDILCPSDRLAILVAETLLGRDDLELWDHERLVVRLRGTDDGSAVA